MLLILQLIELVSQCLDICLLPLCFFLSSLSDLVLALCSASLLCFSDLLRTTLCSASSIWFSTLALRSSSLIWFSTAEFPLHVH